MSATPPSIPAPGPVAWPWPANTAAFYVGTVSLDGVITSINGGDTFTPDQVIGRAVVDLAPGAEPSFPNALAAIKAGAEAARAEFPVARRAGTRWLACHLVPIRSGATTDGVLVVAFDVTESRQADVELRMTVNALHRLLEDREGLAADLHDGILQSLYGVGLRLEAARGAEGSAPANPHLDRAIAQLNETMADIRQFITASRSSVAADADWAETLAGVLRGLEVAGGPRFVVELDVRAARYVQQGDRGEIVFIAREAVSNAIRHARASRINIRLSAFDSGVRLDIEDDGVGFDVDRAHTGFGLLTMTRRAGRMGAILTITSHPGEGTKVRLDVAGSSRTNP